MLVIREARDLSPALNLSTDPKIFRRRFAAVVLLFIAHLGTLIECAQAGPFHRGDVDEHVLASAVGLNKSEAF
jgi:hypothetical protein